jgi:hypothetical protein
MEQMQMVMQQMADAYKETQKDRANIDMVIQENERLKSMMAEVAANAIKRVNESSQTTNEMTKEMQNVLNVANKKNM